MSFNFDEDDPFDDISKIMEKLQDHLFKQLKAQGIDPLDLIKQLGSNPNAQSFGFSISMGPDGLPDIRPVNPSEIATSMNDRGSNGFEEPFVDVFFSEETRSYQIVAEVRGVDNPDMVHIKIENDTDLVLHAETGPFKYRTRKQLAHPVDINSLEYTLNNGILEIKVLIR